MLQEELLCRIHFRDLRRGPLLAYDSPLANGSGTAIINKQRGPWGALEFGDIKKRKLAVFRLPCDFGVLSGGSDETRTRDFRRDRRERA